MATEHIEISVKNVDPARLHQQLEGLYRLQGMVMEKEQRELLTSTIEFLETIYEQVMLRARNQG